MLTFFLVPKDFPAPGGRCVEGQLTMECFNSVTQLEKFPGRFQESFAKDTFLYVYLRYIYNMYIYI